jgi:hypothetical protein
MLGAMRIAAGPSALLEVMPLLPLSANGTLFCYAEQVAGCCLRSWRRRNYL